MEVNEVTRHSITDLYQSCLSKLTEIIPSRYAQWLIEDPETHDYRVVAAILPDGESGYDVAHRTGVIGQVFRTAKSIVVPDTRNHPLYDPFDDAIDWELCFPAFAEGNLTAVVNLEGSGELCIGEESWDRVCRVVEEAVQYRAPASSPETDLSFFIKSRKIVIRAERDDGASDIVDMARATARGGETTLLVGDYPEILGGRGPTIAEASQNGLGVSYCFFGAERRLDLLATGPDALAVLTSHKDWWDYCRGRYAFVVLNESDAPTLSS